MADVTSFGATGEAAYAAPPQTQIQIIGHRIIYSPNGTPDHTDYTIETKVWILFSLIPRLSTSL